MIDELYVVMEYADAWNVDSDPTSNRGDDIVSGIYSDFDEAVATMPKNGPYYMVTSYVNHIKIKV